MPAAIPFIIQAVGYYLGVNAIVVAAVTLAASAAISSYQKRKAQRQQRDAYNASLEDRLVMTATANAPRSILYGRARNCDGVVFKGTHGNNSEFYTLVVALGHGESDGIESVYFGDLAVNLISDGVDVGGGGGVGYFVNTAPYTKSVLKSASASFTATGGTGSVVLPFPPVAGSVAVTMTVDGDSYPATPVVVGSTVTVSGVMDGQWTATYQYVEALRYAKVWKYRGAAGQDVSLLLAPRFPGLIKPTDKFQGMTLVVVQLTYDQDVFPTGVPAISAVVRGRRLYDPRTGVTAWSENPALIARDWALLGNGGGAAADEIVDAAFSAAANACDVSTGFILAGGASETRPLFQCGIVCKLDVKPDDLFGEMVLAMAGKWGWSSGRLTVVAGTYRAPVLAIDDTWLTDVEDILVVKDPPQTDVVNVYRPIISNADGYTGTVNGEGSTVAYTSTPMPEVRSSVYIAADGRELPREMTMLGVTRNVHAQHICAVLMRDQRDGLIVQLPCNNKAFILELFDVVTLSLAHFGFVAKQFEVQGWSYEFDKGVKLMLKETAALIYSVNTGLQVLDLAPNTALPLPWLVPVVSGLTVTSGTPALQDGWPQTRTLVQWTAVTDEAVRQSGKIEIQFTEVVTGVPLPANDDWPGVTEEGGATSTTIVGLRARAVYVFRVRAINTLGVRGRWSVQVAHINADPPPLDTPGLAEGAATEIIVGPIDATVYAGGFTSFVPGQTQFTPAVDCEVNVFVQGTIAATNGSGGSAKVNAILHVQVSPAAGLPAVPDRVYKRDVVPAEVWQDTPMLTYAFSAQAGVTYTVGMYYSDHISRTQATTFSTVQTRLELVKR